MSVKQTRLVSATAHAAYLVQSGFLIRGTQHDGRGIAFLFDNDPRLNAALLDFTNGKAKVEWQFTFEGDVDPEVQAIYDELEEELSGEDDVASGDMNGIDFGLIVGAGYNLGTITLEARYSLGLKEALNENVDLKNNVIQVVLAYSF